MQPY
jgi:hypothetical protein